MDEYDKIYAYQDMFRAGKQAKNLWQYIPQKHYEAISDVNVDSDGYWVYLKPGWAAYDLAEDCGIIHVYTIADLKEDLKTIARTDKR